MVAMIEIIPTYVPRDVDDLSLGAENIRKFAKGIHIDVDDGIFAPLTTWPYSGPAVFEHFDLSHAEGLSSEIHLMVKAPREVGLAFAGAGAYRIIAHVEGFASTEDARYSLKAFKEAGVSEVGLGLLFQTPFALIEPLVADCDLVHIMSITRIGTQGIPYEPTAPARIAEFHRLFPDTVISVDGGVSKNNITDLVRAGATSFGVGAAISKAPDPKAAYEELRALAESAVH